MLDFSTLNPWGILGAAAAGFVLGGLWFSPKLFGGAWARSIGKRQEDLGNPALAFATMAVAILVSTTALALGFQAAGIETFVRGAGAGLLVGIGFIFPILLSDAVFPGHVRTWWWINVGYRIACLSLIGGILGATAPESPRHRLEKTVEQAGEGAGQVLEGLKALGK